MIMDVSHKDQVQGMSDVVGFISKWDKYKDIQRKTIFYFVFLSHSEIT